MVAALGVRRCIGTLRAAAGELRGDGLCGLSSDSMNWAPEKRMQIPFEALFL